MAKIFLLTMVFVTQIAFAQEFMVPMNSPGSYSITLAPNESVTAKLHSFSNPGHEAIFAIRVQDNLAIEAGPSEGGIRLTQPDSGKYRMYLSGTSSRASATFYITNRTQQRMTSYIYITLSGRGAGQFFGNLYTNQAVERRQSSRHQTHRHVFEHREPSANMPVYSGSSRRSANESHHISTPSSRPSARPSAATSASAASDSEQYRTKIKSGLENLIYDILNNGQQPTMTAYNNFMERLNVLRTQSAQYGIDNKQQVELADDLLIEIKNDILATHRKQEEPEQEVVKEEAPSKVGKKSLPIGLTNANGHYFEDPRIVADKRHEHYGDTLDASELPITDNNQPVANYPNLALKSIIEYLKDNPEATRDMLDSAHLITGPVTLDIYESPLCTPTGQSFSSESITAMLESNEFLNPLNRQKVNVNTCVPNNNLVKFLENFK